MANRKVSPLTDTEVKNAKPREKEYTLPDGNGLQLLIKPDGKKIWEIRYTINGTPKKTTCGVYKLVKRNGKEEQLGVSIAEARAKRDEIKTKASSGINPIEEKRESKIIAEEQKQADENMVKGQFHNVVYSWLDSLENVESTMQKRKRAFERDIFPYFCKYDQNHNIVSSKHIGDIKHPELVEIINKKAESTQETARRLLTDCRNIWDYAGSFGYVAFDITLKISKKTIQKPKMKHYAKVTDKKILGELLRSIDNYHGSDIVKSSLQFVSIVPLRAENLCKLKWEHVDFKNKSITIPRSEMKIKDSSFKDFTIPLPQQAVAILKNIHVLTGWGVWVFHGLTNQKTHLNKESPNKALRLMGFVDEASGRKQTLHSFRGSFRSLCDTHDKEHGASFKVKESVLDHSPEPLHVRAYSGEADLMEQQRELLTWWADFLDGLKADKSI